MGANAVRHEAIRPVRTIHPRKPLAAPWRGYLGPWRAFPFRPRHDPPARAMIRPPAKGLALASKPPAFTTCPLSAPKALGLQAPLAHGLKAETSLKLRRE